MIFINKGTKFDFSDEILNKIRREFSGDLDVFCGIVGKVPNSFGSLMTAYFMILNNNQMVVAYHTRFAMTKISNVIHAVSSIDSIDKISFFKDYIVVYFNEIIKLDQELNSKSNIETSIFTLQLINSSDSTPLFEYITKNFANLDITKSLDNPDFEALASLNNEKIKKHKDSSSQTSSNKNISNFEIIKSYVLDFKQGFRLDAHIKVSSNSLNGNAKVIYAFPAEAVKWNQSTCVVVITDDGYITIGSKSLLIGEQIKKFRFSDIKEFNLKTGLMFHTISIESLTEVFDIRIYFKDRVKVLYQKLLDLHSTYHNRVKEAVIEKTIINNSSSAADEILKFKTLFDQGIITQEEFETKKKQLLNS